MPKTLFLHIGHYKTGTTALQVFLHRNRQALRRENLQFAQTHLKFCKHSALAFSLYRKVGVTKLMHGYARATPPSKIWEELFEEVRTSRCDSVLASTEEFMRLGAHPDAAELLREIVDPVRSEFDIRIIAYLRPLRSHLKSWYNQLVKMNAGPVPDFDRAVTGLMEPVHYDYGLALQPWVDVFGADNVVVRPYTEEMRGGNALFDDFLPLVGVTPSSRLVYSKKDANPRLDESMLEVTRLLQMAGFRGQELEWAQDSLDRIGQTSSRGEPVRFDDIITRAQAGLELVQNLSEGMEGVTDNLPQRQESVDITVATDLLVYLLRDVQRLRHNLHRKQADLADRLAAVEAKLGIADKDQQ